MELVTESEKAVCYAPGGEYIFLVCLSLLAVLLKRLKFV